MKFNVSSLGENFHGVSLDWFGSLTTPFELQKIEKLSVGDSVEFKLFRTGPFGLEGLLIVVRCE